LLLMIASVARFEFEQVKRRREAVWNAIIRLKEWLMRRLPVFLLAATGLLLAQPKTIVFSRLGPSQIRLFVSNADGTAERPLLNSDTLDYNPVWSPDGQWIVFTSERNGSADLYRVKPEGTGLQRLTINPAYDDQADFSPDGQRLVFVSTRADGT